MRNYPRHNQNEKCKEETISQRRTLPFVFLSFACALLLSFIFNDRKGYTWINLIAAVDVRSAVANDWISRGVDVDIRRQC